MRGGASFWYITLSGTALETSMGSSPAIKQIVKREEVMCIQLVPIYIVCGIYSQHTLPKACTLCPSGANHLRCRPVWGSQQGHGDQCCPPHQLSPSTWACWGGGWPAIHPPPPPLPHSHYPPGQREITIRQYIIPMVDIHIQIFRPASVHQLPLLVSPSEAWLPSTEWGSGPDSPLNLQKVIHTIYRLLQCNTFTSTRF